MDRVTKITIKSKIMLYPKMQKEIAEQMADIGLKTGGIGICGGRSSVKGVKGWDIALIGTMSKEDYLWCKAIEDSVNYFKERERGEIPDTINALYWRQNVNADGLAIKFCVSRATVYNFVDLFMETVHKFALKNGLILDI